MDAPADYLLFAAVMILGASAAGFLAGLFGIGGGFIIVPLLYALFIALGTDPQAALHTGVGTSLAIIIITGFVSARAHFTRGSLDAAILRQWGPPTAAGAALGALAAGQISGQALALIFAAGSILVAVCLLLQSSPAGAPRYPTAPARLPLASGIGALSAMMGVGGGAFATFALTLFQHRIHRAIGTAAGFGPLVALPGAALFLLTGWNSAATPPFSLGYVNLAAFAIFVPFTALCAPLGARTAHALPQDTLRRLFALLCLLVACRFVYDALAGQLAL